MKREKRNIIIYAKFEEDEINCSYDYVIMGDNVIFNRAGSKKDIIDALISKKFGINTENSICIEVICKEDDNLSSLALLSLIDYLNEKYDVEKVYFYDGLLSSARTTSI